jgi:signal transduction histidine kinase
MAPARKTDTHPQRGQTTYFASPQRADGPALDAEVVLAESNPVISAILVAFGGVVAILNRHRQIVAVNARLLRMLGLAEPERLLGLRPGEAMGCIHAAEGPSGCGTGKACTDCGAALAIVASQESNQASEAECLLTARTGEQDQSLEFLARAVPLACNGTEFTVLILQDISARKRLENLQRVLHHDLGNTMTALKTAADLFARADGERRVELSERISTLTLRLMRELRTHRDLARMEAGDYRVDFEEVTVGEVIEGLQADLADSALLADRRWRVEPLDSGATIRSSLPLIKEVLTNMVVNALEATAEGGEVRLTGRADTEGVAFEVWNAGAIPEETARRVFERYHTTKPGGGRGLGTYSMKLIGERYLGGEVGFATDEEDGTRFFLRLPARPAVQGDEDGQP